MIECGSKSRETEKGSHSVGTCSAHWAYRASSTFASRKMSLWIISRSKESASEGKPCSAALAARFAVSLAMKSSDVAGLYGMSSEGSSQISGALSTGIERARALLTCGIVNTRWLDATDEGYHVMPDCYQQSFGEVTCHSLAASLLHECCCTIDMLVPSRSGFQSAGCVLIRKSANILTEILIE